jgi:glycosyltransferase involved in cell wall biosynthesis
VLALGHGRPVIVPDLPALADLPDGATVRYEGTVGGLTEALAWVAEADGDTLAAMAAAARRYAQTLSWTEIAEATVAEITAAVAARRPHGAQLVPHGVPPPATTRSEVLAPVRSEEAR